MSRLTYNRLSWKVPITNYGDPYQAFYPWGKMEWHIRCRGGVKRVRAGWAKRWLRKHSRGLSGTRR